MFNQLTNMEQWRVLKFRSKKAPVLILKHSNTCSTCAQALQDIRDAQSKKIIEQPINLVVVQENREISNKIEKELKIKHESPQVIVMRDEKSIYNASHEKIDVKKIAQALK